MDLLDDLQFKYSFGSFGRGPGQFDCPMGGCYSEKRNRIFITEMKNCRVQIFNNGWEPIHQFGSPGRDLGQFNHPTGICESKYNSNILVADANNFRVQIFDSNSMIPIRSIPTSQFTTIVNTMNSGGNIIVGGSDNVQIFDRDGNPLYEFKEYTRGNSKRFISAFNIWCNSREELIVFDMESDILSILDSRGCYLQGIHIPHPIVQPQTTWVDDNDNIIVLGTNKARETCLLVLNSFGEKIKETRLVHSFKFPIEMFSVGNRLAIIDKDLHHVCIFSN